MHEVGIAAAILEAAHAETARRSRATLVRVGVRVGVLSGVDKEALRFALTALTQETDLQQVSFEVETCARRNRCLDCDRQFESSLYATPGPDCGSDKTALTGGDELDLTYVEVEEP
jgi:hydrogenase nickel incorporation protein HypA/HybF